MVLGRGLHKRPELRHHTYNVVLRGTIIYNASNSKSASVKTVLSTNTYRTRMTSITKSTGRTSKTFPVQRVFAVMV